MNSEYDPGVQSIGYQLVLTEDRDARLWLDRGPKAGGQDTKVVRRKKVSGTWGGLQL